MKTLAACLGGCLIFLAGTGSASASAISAQQSYTYTLSLPDIDFPGGTEDDSTFTQYQFTWQGPFLYDSGLECPDTCGPVSDGAVNGGTVSSGYNFVGMSFFSDIFNGQPEVEVEFQDGSNYIDFYFDDPNSFWASPGTYTFDNNSPDDNYFATGSEGLAQGLGIVPSGSESDCSECSVTIIATPEPGTSFLLSSALASAFVLFRRRRNVRAL